MTDTSQQIDPKRPWIDDARDAPATMKFLPSLLFPGGRTSRVHFTRGWTILFFARLFSILIPFALMAVFGAAGAETQALGVLYGLVPLTFVLTLLMSTVLHARRLADAERPAALAGLVWLPVLLGVGVFLLLVATQSPDLATSADSSNGFGRPQNPQDQFQSWVSGQASLAFLVYAITLVCVTVWSLLWVGRLPNGGGRIKDRFAA
ncbi:MAG: DUF805 domain-containing protein [Pseudomonadota bacterium]